MNADLVGLVGALGAAAWCLYLWRLRHTSRPLWREKRFAVSAPFPFFGIPDLVWQEKDGSLTIHDLKTRGSHRVFKSDILQLSLYKLLVERATGRRVNPWGIVRVRTGDGREKLMRVALMPENELTAVYADYWNKVDGNAVANKCGTPAYCEKCGFRGRECR